MKSISKVILLCTTYIMELGIVSASPNPIPLNYTASEKECMALAVYGEARGESKIGQLLVIEVINNRRMSNKYPNHVCDVIKQRRQFSFWGGVYKAPKNKRVYKDIQKIINLYLSARWGYGVTGLSKGSMWYHADYIKPKWAKNLKQVWYVGRHIFYKQL